MLLRVLYLICRNCSQPIFTSSCASHWDAAIQILRYIKSAPGQGLCYVDRGTTQIIGYSDADWVRSPIDRRSTAGYCVLIGGNLIHEEVRNILWSHDPVLKQSISHGLDNM